MGKPQLCNRRHGAARPSGACGTNHGSTAARRISFGLELASAPIVHVIPVGGPNPSGCSGSASDPGAASGNLCIFEGFNTVGEVNLLSSHETEATRFGAIVHATSTGAGQLLAWGTWAVTDRSRSQPRGSADASCDRECPLTPDGCFQAQGQ
jgi:hypothetical protein